MAARAPKRFKELFDREGHFVIANSIIAFQHACIQSRILLDAGLAQIEEFFGKRARSPANLFRCGRKVRDREGSLRVFCLLEILHYDSNLLSANERIRITHTGVDDDWQTAGKIFAYLDR